MVSKINRRINQVLERLLLKGMLMEHNNALLSLRSQEELISMKSSKKKVVFSFFTRFFA